MAFRSFSAVAHATKSILMCRPTYFTVKYIINPWMEKTVDNTLAQTQWNALKIVLEGLGTEINVLEGKPDVPDLVFTANAGLMLPKNKVLLSHFANPERRLEEVHFKRWFEDHGYEVLESDVPFEGAGDSLYLNDVLFAGYGQRTKASSYDAVKKLGVKTVPCELKNPRFYHIDVAFCPLDSETALWYPNAFTEASQELMKAAVPRLIPVSKEDASCFGCNAVAVGNNVVMATGAKQVLEDLDRAGFKTTTVDMSEFLKAGGSCKCLTLAL